MSLARAARVEKRFGDVRVLAGVDLEVGEGEVVALLGPSGCGKTTLLRIVAGLERADAGEVSLGEQLVDGPRIFVPPEARRVGLVFQDYALFPHLTVEANVAFGLRGAPAATRAARVREVLRAVDAAELADRHPHALSGGQQQRIALARALAPSPRLVLLDEPFSNLDAGLRRKLRLDLRALLGAVRVGALFVTHDQDEALSLADRVAVMHAGRILQVASPREIYERPGSVAVARATGLVNVLAGQAAGGVVRCALGQLEGEGPDGEVDVLLRPEALRLGSTGAPARIVARDYVGREELLSAEVEGATCVCRSSGEVGDRLAPRGPVRWVARTDPSVGSPLPQPRVAR